MKRYILCGSVMLITFVIGFSVDRLIQYSADLELAPAPVAQLAPELNVIPPPPPPLVPIAAIPDEPNTKPEATLILDYDVKKIVRYGFFSIIGAKPREFADFDSIELDLVGAEPPYGGYIAVNTIVAPDRYDRANAIFALATERRLFFVTSKTQESGVEYRFDGEFLIRDFDFLVDENAVALRGTLTKTKNGRTIASRVVSFRIEHMGC